MGLYGSKKFPMYLYLVLSFLCCKTWSTASNGHHVDTSVLRKLNAIHQKAYGESRNVQISQRHPKKPVWNQRYIHKIVNRIHHLRLNPAEDTSLQRINRQTNGFSGDRCDTDSDCVEPRKCFVLEDEEIISCNGSGVCICLSEVRSDVLCSCNDLECLEGDVCSALDEDTFGCFSTDNENFEPLECTSPPPSPSSSPSPSESVQSGEESNFTGDRCSEDDDCTGPRRCGSIDDGEIGPCLVSSDCFCFPIDENLLRCSCDDLECLDGDVCVGVGDEDDSLCIATDNDNFTPLECISPSPSPSPSPSISESTRPGEGNSFTGGSCEVNLDCAGSRVCVDRVNEETVPCASPSGCFCAPINQNDLLCSCEDPECLEGDSCSDLGDDVIACISTDLEGNTPVVCETASPSPGPSGPLVTQITRPPPPRPTPPDCIDAKALSHMDRLQLLYEPHVVSRVLCDEFGSCATAGHIVFHKGTPMMMMKYCEKVGCESRVIEVNSPRYQRGMRLPSKTADLEYSVFAARYGTRAEEVALVAAIRLGL